MLQETTPVIQQGFGMARHKRRLDKPTPAGCLKGDGLHSGDENVEPFAAPEEKAAETRGHPRQSFASFTHVILLDAGKRELPTENAAAHHESRDIFNKVRAAGHAAWDWRPARPALDASMGTPRICMPRKHAE
jgi:hypothetical protein